MDCHLHTFVCKFHLFSRTVAIKSGLIFGCLLLPPPPMVFSIWSFNGLHFSSQKPLQLVVAAGGFWELKDQNLWKTKGSDPNFTSLVPDEQGCQVNSMPSPIMSYPKHEMKGKVFAMSHGAPFWCHKTRPASQKQVSISSERITIFVLGQCKLWTSLLHALEKPNFLLAITFVSLPGYSRRHGYSLRCQPAPWDQATLLRKNSEEL